MNFYSREVAKERIKFGIEKKVNSDYKNRENSKSWLFFPALAVALVGKADENSTDEDPEPPFNQPLWMDSKTLSDPVSSANPEIVFLLKKAKVCSTFYKMDPANAVWYCEKAKLISEIVDLKMIETTLLKAHELAMKEETLEKYPTIVVYTLYELAKYYSDLAEKFHISELYYRKINKYLTNTLNYPLNNNSVLELGINMADVYFKQNKIKEFSEILNWVETTTIKNISELEQHYPTIITKEIIKDKKNLEYFAVNNLVKYYLDAHAIKCMALDLWIDVYRNNVDGKQFEQICAEGLLAVKELYNDSDLRVIIAKANYALSLTEINKNTESLKLAKEIESDIIKYSDEKRKNLKSHENIPDFLPTLGTNLYLKTLNSHYLSRLMI